jgi:hypothetical protein
VRVFQERCDLEQLSADRSDAVVQRHVVAAGA